MAAADAGLAFAQRRTRWFGATIALTLAPFVIAVALAPGAGAAPFPALVWLLFVGSSMHVGATAWFYTVPEVRAHMSRNRTRYVWAPAVLVAGWAVLAGALDQRQLAWPLLGFFAWQFFHFQKQNLGIAAVAARAARARGLSTTERRALTVAGIGGIAALVGHPGLLQVVGLRELSWMFVAGAGVFAAAAVVGVVCLLRRDAADRPSSYAVIYLLSLGFFLPVFCFASPYAAVAGLTIAHGLQYLLLVGLLAAAPSPATPSRVGVLILFNLALGVGVLLNWTSHLHGGGAPARVLFGVYLGLVSAHFVVDAGLWRLRDEFPRTFLTQRLPFLLAPR